MNNIVMMFLLSDVFTNLLNNSVEMYEGFGEASQ